MSDGHESHTERAVAAAGAIVRIEQPGARTMVIVAATVEPKCRMICLNPSHTIVCSFNKSASLLQPLLSIIRSMVARVIFNFNYLTVNMRFM